MRPRPWHHDTCGDIDGVALSGRHLLLRGRHGRRLLCRAVAPTRHMESLDEWGLGGRGFGTIITWFLLGGDLYTAYTFVAVPAAMYATGAISGFFAVPYTIIVYPADLHLHAAAVVGRAREGLRHAGRLHPRPLRLAGLSLAVALTGILATMPYIALQLVGIQAVLDTIGLGGAEQLVRAETSRCSSRSRCSRRSPTRRVCAHRR